jgi:hypothetical protein
VCFAALQALQTEGAWHEAERHFCEAKEWKGAVAMYRQQGSWEDALRVAKVLGGQEAATQVGSGRADFVKGLPRDMWGVLCSMSNVS